MVCFIREYKIMYANELNLIIMKLISCLLTIFLLLLMERYEKTYNIENMMLEDNDDQDCP